LGQKQNLIIDRGDDGIKLWHKQVTNPFSAKTARVKPNKSTDATALPSKEAATDEFAKRHFFIPMLS